MVRTVFNKNLRTCAFCGWVRVYVGQYFFVCRNCGFKNKIKDRVFDNE